MKPLATIFLLAITASCLFAQVESPSKSNFVMVINGKDFSNGAVIDSQDLKHLDSIVLRNLQTKRTYPLYSFRWIVAKSGQVIRGSYPQETKDKNNLTPSLSNLVENMKKGDAVFIQEMKLNNGKITLPGQWALKVE